MWLRLITQLVLVCQVSSTIIFQKIEHWENEVFTLSDYRITNIGAKNYLNWNCTIVQPWDKKIMVQTEIFFLPNNRTPAFPLPRLNFCNLATVSKHVPFLSDMFALIAKYAKGSGLTRCPLKVGLYRLENIFIDDSAFKELMWLKPNSRYMAHIVIQDENGPKPVTIAKVKYYVLYKTNKGKGL